MSILGPYDGLICCDEPSRQFVVPILVLVGKPLLESRHETLPTPALCLGEPLGRLAQFVRMGNLLAGGERQEMTKPWINPYRTIASVRNGLRLCVNEQAEIPSRRPLDDASTFDASCGDILRMEPHMAEPWYVETCTIGSFERIRKRDTGELVPLAF